MAIDTRNKRASVIGFDRMGGIFPNPDGSLANANDRAHIAMKYAGTLAASTFQVAWAFNVNTVLVGGQKNAA